MSELDTNELTEEETVETPEIADEGPDFPPHPTPEEEEEEEWERQRIAEWEAKLAPYKALKEAVQEHDDLMADTLYELTLIELGMEDDV